MKNNNFMTLFYRSQKEIYQLDDEEMGSLFLSNPEYFAAMIIAAVFIYELLMNLMEP